MHDTDIDKDLRDMINAAMSVAGTPDDVRERVLEREEARVRENLELDLELDEWAADQETWELLDDQEPSTENTVTVGEVRVGGPVFGERQQPSTALVTAIQETQAAVTDVHFEALVLGQFKAMETLWRAAPVSFHSAAVQTEFALNLELLVAAQEPKPSTST